MFGRIFEHIAAFGIFSDIFADHLAASPMNWQYLGTSAMSFDIEQHLALPVQWYERRSPKTIPRQNDLMLNEYVLIAANPFLNLF